MDDNFYLSTLAICLISLSSIANAAEPVVLQSTSFKTLQQDFHVVLPDTPKDLIEANNTLKFTQDHTDQNQVTHVRMQQQYVGFPVYRGYAIIHSAHSTKELLGANGTVKMNGMIFKGLEKELGKPNSSFVKNGAQVLQDFKAQYQNYATSDEKITPMVYIGDDNRASWAYKVSVLVEFEDKIPERPTAILDAKTHKPFIQWNDLKTAHTAVKGEGFGGNIRTSKFHFGEKLPFLDIRRDGTKELCFMENEGAKVVNMNHRYQGVNRVMQFTCKFDRARPHSFWTGPLSDGYDLDNGAYSPSNDALYTGYVINQMYTKWYGLPPLTKANKAMQLVMRVHYGRGYENAFWDGEQMTFGDGDTMMHPLVSLGVGAHEISHGFTEQHSNLAYYGQSGGMNEAFSDMAAQAAEFYSRRSSSWKIGAEIMKKDSGYTALRFMKKPSLDGSSIDNADEYYGGLDVHYSSGVYNRLFYLLAHQPGWNTRLAFNIMVKANMDYWTPYSSFDEGGCGVINAASDLGMSTDMVKKSLDDVKINYDKCDTSIIEQPVV